MGTNQEWFACEKGHPVLAGSTVCTKCGAQVTGRRISPDAPTPSSPLNAKINRRTVLVMATSVAVTVASAGVILAMVASQQDSPGPTLPSGPVPTSCEDGGVVEINLGVPYLDAPPVSCFTVAEETSITIGARGSVGSDLSLMIERIDGVFWAAADNTHGSDPGLSTIFLPGSYLITVTDWLVSPPDAFTLYSVVSDSADPWSDINAALPALSECGSASVPLLDTASSHMFAHASRYSCVVIGSDGFVKFGAITDEGNPADLSLAVHSFNESGRPQFINSVDNAFGTDPEMSLDLAAGTYLIEVGESTGASLGGFSMYVDAAQTYFRRGSVSTYLASLTPSDCTDGTLPALTLGSSQSLSEAKALGCVTLDTPARIVVDAASTANQDLTLEVVGFDEDGAPVRYGWADDYLWAASPDQVDPRLDIVLPAGVYVIAVSPLGGGAGEGLTLTIALAG